MSGGKGGSSPSTAGMERVARESNELQRQMYEEGVARAQPYYDVGVSGLGKLADYLGLAGGSMQSESQIRDSLTPQYTTTQTVTPATTGKTLADFLNAPNKQGADPITQQQRIQNYAKYMASGGNEPTAAVTEDVLDQAGLDAAVQNALATQTENQPDYYGSLLQTFGADQFEVDPGYAFRQAEGNKAIERQLSAMGQSFTPAAVQELQKYNQDLASQEYQNAYNRYNADQSNIYNRLANIAGVGQTTAEQLTGLGQNYAGNVGQTSSSLANAQYQAAVADAQNRSSMFGTLGSLGGAAIGGVFGGPSGAMLGSSLGGTLGGLF